MKRFSGYEIKPFSQVTDLKRVRIDRVCIEVRQTLFGEVEFDVIGRMGMHGEGWPLCRPLETAAEAFRVKDAITAEIERARKEEQMAEIERSRKDVLDGDEDGIPPSAGTV